MPKRLVVGLFLVSCATVSPRFDQDVQTSFARDGMRYLRTSDVELYYPAPYAEQARRVAARASQCLTALRSHQLTRGPRGRALLFLTSANFNNAYVSGQSVGEPLHSVNPLTTTSERFHWYALPGADSGDIACHEMFHFAHFEQVDALWKYVNLIVGPVFAPQQYLERWFTEGVAQYYEGRIARAVGRPNSPLYRMAWDSFVAMREGRIEGGDLTLFQRELGPHTGAYLTGLFFIEHLVERYGEDRLWALMQVQGRDVFSPFGVTLRFRSVYGKTLDGLLGEWSDELKRTVVRRARPAGQAVLRSDLGQLARLATHPASGTIAVVSSGVDQVPLLRLLKADGALIAERRLIRLGIDREWILANPDTMSGLSFTADGKFLFLLNDDLVDRGDTRAQLWKVDAASGEVLKVWHDLGRGMGGAVSPDGQRYTLVEMRGEGGTALIELDLTTRARTELLSVPFGKGLGAPAWSPDHSRLVVSVLDGNGWNLLLREADGSTRALTTDGQFTYGAQWVDGSTIIFPRTHDGRLQVHRLELTSGELTVISDAPHGIIDPRPMPGGAVAVLNRDGIRWSLDVVAAGSVSAAASAPVSAPLEAPARDEPPPLHAEVDEPYNPVDQLFVPQLRAPGVQGTIVRTSQGTFLPLVTVSASLMGRDRLAFHAWAINAFLTLPTLENTVSVAYRNLQLAPWAITAAAARTGFESDPQFPGALWSASLTASRRFWVTDFSAGARAFVDQDFTARTNRYIGPFLGLAYGAAEATAYGGVQRQLAMSVDLAAYPRGLGSDRDIGDLRAAVSFGIPFPAPRMSALVFLTGRVLPGAPSTALRLGGVPRATQLTIPSGTTIPPGPGVFLPGGLVESVRGFDDYAVRAAGAFIATLRYRYSFIIDRGWASVLWIFPSLFFRQVDVEAFGALAVTDNPTATFMRAAGAAAFLRIAVGGYAVASLYYQFAYRFDFGLAPLHSFGIALE